MNIYVVTTSEIFNSHWVKFAEFRHRALVYIDDFLHCMTILFVIIIVFMSAESQMNIYVFDVSLTFVYIE